MQRQICSAGNTCMHMVAVQQLKEHGGPDTLPQAFADSEAKSAHTLSVASTYDCTCGLVRHSPCASPCQGDPSQLHGGRVASQSWLRHGPARKQPQQRDEMLQHNTPDGGTHQLDVVVQAIKEQVLPASGALERCGSRRREIRQANRPTVLAECGRSEWCAGCQQVQQDMLLRQSKPASATRKDLTRA